MEGIKKNAKKRGREELYQKRTKIGREFSRVKKEME